MEDQYNAVIDSIKLLAMPYERQVTMFPNFVDIPFEIIDTFNEAFLLLPDLIEKEYFTNKGIASIIRIFNWIQLTSSNPLLKDYNEIDFMVAPQWEKLREMSKEALNHL
jgi:hypothetical protein